jgi:dienelactone hydrolase
LLLVDSQSEPRPFDPVVDEPPPDDTNHPAKLVELAFESHGSRLNGVALVPSGPGPHPTAIVLHGFPGYERNLDLAHALRRAGWTALVFHYRGAWGSQGEFSFGHVLEDVQTALALVGSPAARTGLRTDPDRVALVGHSMGGWAAFLTVAERGDLLGAASIAGYNFAGKARQVATDPVAVEAELHWYRAESRPLVVRDPRALFDELLEHGDEWDLISVAGALATRRLLVVGATQDTEAPFEAHHLPLVASLRIAEHLEEVVFDTDHTFSSHRIALARVVVSWLSSLLE